MEDNPTFIVRLGTDEFYGTYNFMAGVDRVSLAWAGGELIMRKGGLLSMEICPSPLKEVLQRKFLDSGQGIADICRVSYYANWTVMSTLDAWSASRLVCAHRRRLPWPYRTAWRPDQPLFSRCSDAGEAGQAWPG